MSLIGAICDRRGQPVDPALTERLASAGVLLRPSRTATLTEGCIGLAVEQFAHTLRCGDPPQPVASRFRGSLVLLDGRFDNRDDVVRELGGRGACEADAHDAELLAAAYDTWGPDCAARLHGEFAWIVWDRIRNRLVAARDAFGLRPLYYGFAGDRLVCGSQIDQVQAAVRDPALSEDFLADYFVHSYVRPALTPYAAIRRLPPAHRLVLEEGRLRVERYWDLEDAPKLNLPDRRDYVEGFRALFEEGVRRQLRSAGGPVWADLSGGLDSSSITCVAATHLRDAPGDVDAERFATLSWVAEQTRGDQDASLQREVVERFGLVNHRLSADEHHAFQEPVEAARYWDEPAAETFSYALQRQGAELVARHGVSALLRGVGAECVVLSEREPPLHLADLLRERRIGRWYRETLVWQRALGEPLLVMLGKYVLKPLLRPGTISTGAFSRWPATSDWLSDGFKQRTGLRHRKAEPWQPRRFRSAADQWQYEQLAHVAGYTRPGVMHKCCDVRMPFLYRPLVEFGFRLPWTEKVQPGTYKQLLRDAMEGTVPERVRTWRKKIGATRTVHRALDLEFDSLRGLLRDSRLHDAGILDARAVEREMDLLRYGAHGFTSGLLRPAAVEAWLRARETSAPTARAHAVPA
jgi:asparagine synthase (glutamine-hydrolysing)